jgi:hypothetical protein
LEGALASAFSATLTGWDDKMAARRENGQSSVEGAGFDAKIDN